MNQTRFLNTSQPQTLVIATILLYLHAFFNLLSGWVLPLIGIALAAGGFGIANERKWGYSLAVAGAIAQVVVLVAVFGLGGVLFGARFIRFLFDGALVLLLLHPMSRDYQKIWFR